MAAIAGTATETQLTGTDYFPLISLINNLPYDHYVLIAKALFALQIIDSPEFTPYPEIILLIGEKDYHGMLDEHGAVIDTMRSYFNDHFANKTPYRIRQTKEYDPVIMTTLGFKFVRIN